MSVRDSEVNQVAQVNTDRNWSRSPFKFLSVGICGAQPEETLDDTHS